MSKELTAQDLIVGDKYNWKGQAERLVFIGQRYNWYRFALTRYPEKVWTEVLKADLRLMEKTK